LIICGLPEYRQHPRNKLYRATDATSIRIILGKKMLLRIVSVAF
jgi:hypothetical protein